MTEYTSAQVGTFGEDYCSKYIKKHKKLKVLGRYVTIGKLEVDIIATNKDYIVFIEVKTRRQEKSNFYRPAHAVDYAKRTNLLNFAYAYCKTLPEKHRNKIPRIDVCEIYLSGSDKLTVSEINYIENAVGK